MTTNEFNEWMIRTAIDVIVANRNDILKAICFNDEPIHGEVIAAVYMYHKENRDFEILNLIADGYPLYVPLMDTPRGEYAILIEEIQAFYKSIIVTLN